MNKFASILVFSFALGLLMTAAPDELNAQRKGTHTDESKVPKYDLPELLICSDGTKIDSAKDWESKRRPEVLQLFADHVYGGVPPKEVEVSYATEVKSWEVLNGDAIRMEVTMRIGSPDSKTKATMLLTIPTSDKPAPCFLGYNFHGNHTTTTDNKISIPTSWVRDNKKLGAIGNKASEKGRGSSASRWPYKEIISKGYGVCTIYYGDLDPDIHDEFKNGVHPHFYANGQTKPSKNEWGSIGAWAWGLSRALDGLEAITQVDSERVAVIGHSRLGKTSLWAGATDSRFWITISNNSGCGGAALHRRKFGETVKVINTNFPHWFCDQFAEYNENESAIPVDQHMLMALMAPRPVYVASATKDLWADPKGEYLSLLHSGPVFKLYGESDLPGEQPKPDQPVVEGSRGYHLRTGKHDINIYDWSQYIEFANRHLKK